MIKNNEKENCKRINHQHQVGDIVLIIRKPGEIIPKLFKPTEGPCDILAVHNNDNVTILRGMHQERINIRLIKPHYMESERNFQKKEEQSHFASLKKQLILGECRKQSFVCLYKILYEHGVFK